MKESTPSIEDILKKFIAEIEGLADAFPLIHETTTSNEKKHFEKLITTVKKHSEEIKNSDGSTTYKIKEHISNIGKLERKFHSSISAKKFFPRSFLISLISAYDAFLSDLMRTFFLIKPELLNSLNHEISLCDLLKYKDIEDAKNAILHKKIEDIFREGHLKQLQWLEKHFKIPLTEDVELINQFIEISERRNLFVHCDGIISDQYISNCSKYKKCTKKKGETLHINEKYFHESYLCIFELGIKTAHTIWRHLLKNNLEDSDSNLIEIVFSLNDSEQTELSKKISTFTTNLPKYHNEEKRRYLIINKAIAFKNAGEEESAIDIIESEDWSSCGKELLFATLVIKNKYQAAIKIMKELGDKNEVFRKDAYQTWPLFKFFRNKKSFLNTYQSIFNEPFSIEQDIKKQK